MAFLLIHGELPSIPQLDDWEARVNRHTMLHEDVYVMMKSFRYNAHPMGMLISAISR